MSLFTGRELGKYNISIGTSQALEALESFETINDYNDIYLNVKTLIRNILSSMSIKAEERSDLNLNELTEVLIDEISQIVSVLREGFGKLKPTFYYCEHNSLQTLAPKDTLQRVIRTPVQRFYHNLYQTVLWNIKDYYKNDEIEFIRNNVLTKLNLNAFFLTSTLADIITSSGFKDIQLLESHTGKIKDRSQWYTKFSSEALPNIPPIKQMLYIYGDSEFFRPQLVRYRRLVDDAAINFKWTTVTTLERIRLSLGYIPNMNDKLHLLNLIKA